MKRKILSLALALMMIVSVAAAMPVSAAVGDITYLSVTDDGFDPKGGESTAAVTVVTDQAVKGGDAQSWAGTSLAKVTTVKKNISWTFDVPETGLYNIYIAASTNAGHRIDVTANGTKIANYMEINVDSVGNADTASGAFQLYPTETLIAKSIAFTNGADNVLKVSHAGGGSKTIAVYMVKFELISGSEPEPEPEPDPEPETDVTYLIPGGEGFNNISSTTIATDQAVKGGNARSWAGTTLSKVTTVKTDIGWTFDVPETGLYNIYIAASTNAGHRIDVTANGTEIANYMELNVDSTGDADTASGAFQLYPTETLIASSVAFTNGADNVLNVSHAGGGSKTIAVYKVKLELVVSESELEPGAIRITDDIGNVLSNIETGSPVMAVVALDKSVEGVNIFFVQYAGSGDTRRMVDYTFTRAGSSIVGSTGEYNYYRVMTTVAADVTEIKAFVWTTDDKYVPLCDAVAVQ